MTHKRRLRAPLALLTVSLSIEQTFLKGKKMREMEQCEHVEIDDSFNFWKILEVALHAEELSNGFTKIGLI